MKKFLSMFCMLMMLTVLFSNTAGAEDGEMPEDTVENVIEENNLPFILEAPKYVFLDRISEDKKVQTVNAAFSKNASMTEYFDMEPAAAKRLINANGLATLKLTAQVDWAIDSPDDWHYNEYWDTEGLNAKKQKVLGDWAYIGIEPEKGRVQSVQIFEDFGNIKDKDNKAWKGTDTLKGWKSVIPEALLSKNSDNEHSYIDWTKHVLYIRVRYVVVTEDNDEEFKKNTYYSDWSETAAFGKDIEEYYPYETYDKLPIPEVYNLAINQDEDGYVLEYDVKLPEEFEKNAAQTEVYGGVAYLVHSIFVQDYEVVPSYQTPESTHVAIPVAKLLPEGVPYTEGTPIFVRSFIWIDQYLGVGGQWVGELENFQLVDLYSVGAEEEPEPTPEITATPTLEPTPVPTQVIELLPTAVPEVKEEEENKNVCKICKLSFDPQFMDICMFFWLGGALLIIIIISIIVKIIRRREDEKTDILFR